MARKAFSIHSDYYEELKGLSDEQRSAVLLALINWSTDTEIPMLDSACAVLFRLMTSQMERISAVNAANGAKGGVAKQAKASENSEGKRIKPSVTVSVTDTVSVTEKEKESGAAAPSPPEKPIKYKHGVYGWVRLADAEYERLVKDHGEETVKRYIAVVDELAQQTGNKNRWKDWNLTVRKAIRDKWGSTVQQGRASPPKERTADTWLDHHVRSR